jgi:hypothetical protein
MIANKEFKKITSVDRFFFKRNIRAKFVRVRVCFRVCVCVRERESSYFQP